MRGRVGTLIVCAVVLWTSGASLARASTDGGARLLVAFADDASAADREAALHSIGGTIAGAIPAIGVTRVVTATERDAVWASARIAHMPGVRFAEPDASVHVGFVPNDSLYLTDPYTGLGQWGLRMMRVDRAWDLARGSSKVIVATIDTGVDAAHPDLADSLLPPVSTITSTDPECQAGALDDNSHGTHVAGIIAAGANNGAGVSGVAFGVKILSIKALDCTGAGAISDVSSAIVYAADHGARVVNISLGTGDDSLALRSAVRYAQDKGLLIVAAAGNCGVVGPRCDAVNQVEYPAAYPGVLAVAATTTGDTHAAFSSQGLYVGVAAPGDRIVSTTPSYATYQSARGQSRGYGVLSGTSQAAPFVSGLAALILSKDPTLTAAQLVTRIEATADDLGAPGFDTSFGAGRVNALRAVSAPGGTYGAVYDTTKVPASAATGATFMATVKLTNTSSFAWPANGQLRLAYHWLDASGRTVIWEGTRSALPASLPINGSIDLPTTIVTPKDPGRYALRFDMVNEGVAWFSGTGVPDGDAAVSVSNGFGASYAIGSSAFALKVGRPTSLAVTLTNTGTRTWPAAGSQPVHLGYHLLAPNGFVLVWDGSRANLATDVAPGQSATVQLPVSAPYGGGYVLRLDLVQEGVSWFSGEGVLPDDLAVAVSP